MYESPAQHTRTSDRSEFSGQPPAQSRVRFANFLHCGNLFLGFLAILQAIEGALYAAGGNLGFNPHFELAAKVIIISIFFDGLDGRIARMTNTTSDFGRELDSLADVISFGIAPAVLGFVWGFYFLDPATPEPMRRYIMQAGYFLIFCFVLCGAARLARFNVTTNPKPRNPGRRIANILWVCRFQPQRAWWPPWCISSNRSRWSLGRWYARGWHCSACCLT